MGTQPSFSQSTTLTNKALEWLHVLRSPNATPKDFAAFRSWRDADQAHLIAWQQLVNNIDDEFLKRFSTSALPAPKDRLASKGRRRLLTALGGTLVGGTALALATDTVYPLSHLTADAATGTSERRRYTLSDGSQLTLDARSSVNLNYTPYLRQLNLRTGAVVIQASADEQRPFLTLTSEGIIRANHARYMVRQDPHRTLVVAHDKPVYIQTRSGSHFVLEPHYGLRFDEARIGEPSRQMARRAAWEDGHIEASGTTLNEIITALRPYYSGTLRITVAAGGLPVHGKYSLDDVDGTLRKLENDLPITVQRFTPWVRSITVDPNNDGSSA
jgi:transmembrane sensor